ncbi:MAG: tetratricopeptide repeat protein [Anaerolineae bacterium]|nr:tetratricopeptide repeat protein [Anaerolineae bacterium]
MGNEPQRAGLIRRFITWLGPARAWTLFGLLAVSGTISLMLQAVGTDTPWVVLVQNALILVWLVGTVAVLAGRLQPADRRNLIIAVGPTVVGVGIGVLVPDFLPWFVGAGVGWLVVSQVLLRRSTRREYRQAIRYLRRSEYDQAVAVMNDLIRDEPDDAAHLRFRAELHRLNGQPRQALKDYRRIVKLEPDSGVGYNGLAEVFLQEGEYEQAMTHAQRAYELEPEHWVMPYNLGMIADRMDQSEQVITALDAALAIGVTEGRHLALVHLWRARAYARLGRTDEAGQALDALRGQRRGVHEWQTIFASEQAATLRDILAVDVALARRALDGAGPEIFAAGQAEGAGA